MRWRDCATALRAVSFTDKPKDFVSMSLHLSIGPLVSLIAGILILLMPKLLNLIVALYLILMGVLGLVGIQTLRLSGG